MKEMSWSLAGIWNKSFSQRKARELIPRKRIWASEIGGSMIDRYLKMTGVPPTNPPNARSLRKFEAGNIWEAIIKHVLNRAGILISSQDWLRYQYEAMLPVTGKLDFLAGGTPDYEQALVRVEKEFEWLPESIQRATKNIILFLKDTYPEGLRTIILELKSCSAYMYDLYERNNTPSPNHKLQLFHYLKAKSMEEGHICYVCRDDARLLEFGVFNPSVVEEDYKKDIQRITRYLALKQTPPLEEPIIYDKDFNKFSANYRVGYSSYLTKLYGFENQKGFDDKYKPIVGRFNRVLGRIEQKKEMTENNLEVIQEIEEMGFNFAAIKKGITKKEGV